MSSRMTAEQRRAQLINVASKLFARHGYRDTTTAQIAKAAKVTEPVIYRHFPSKRDLYIACVEVAWGDVRGRLEAAVETERDPAAWTTRLATVGVANMRDGGRAQLWLQLHSEAAADPKIKRFAADNLRDVHEFITGVIVRAQQAGGVASNREPHVEAWISLAIALLAATVNRVGRDGLVDFNGIIAARQAWLGVDTQI